MKTIFTDNFNVKSLSNFTDKCLRRLYYYDDLTRFEKIWFRDFEFYIINKYKHKLMAFSKAQYLAYVPFHFRENLKSKKYK